MSPAKNLLACALAFGLTTSAALAAAKPRSVSTSRQFLVYGTDVALRGAICDLAERTKANLIQLLDQRDDWKTPLVINLDYPQANFPDAPPARLEVSQLGYGIKLQLNLFVTNEIEGGEVQRELLCAILIEFMYRDRGDIAAGTPYVTPPDWLLDGILGLEPEVDWDENARLLQSFVAENRIAPLEDVVWQRRAQLDAGSRKLYDAYSQALVQLLLDAPGGRQKLVRYLTDLPAAPNDALADLRVHFPETLARATDKWWTLSVARLSATDRYEVMSVAQTAAQLDRVLHFAIAAPDGTAVQYSLGDYSRFRRLPGQKAALELAGRQLLLLGARVHPSYHAIVQEEYSLVQLLLRGKTHGMRERLERVASYRAVVERQAQEIDDYLNWYEATQLKTLSGAFTQALKPAGETQARRRDPISVYLDSIEMEADL